MVTLVILIDNISFLITLLVVVYPLVSMDFAKKKVSNSLRLCNSFSIQNFIRQFSCLIKINGVNFSIFWNFNFLSLSPLGAFVHSLRIIMRYLAVMRFVVRLYELLQIIFSKIQFFCMSDSVAKQHKLDEILLHSIAFLCGRIENLAMAAASRQIITEKTQMISYRATNRPRRFSKFSCCCYCCC